MAFSRKNAHFLGRFFFYFLAKNRDFYKFSSNRLKKAFLGFSRLRFFSLESHDSCRSGDSERLKSKAKKSMSLKFTSLHISIKKKITASALLGFKKDKINKS